MAYQFHITRMNKARISKKKAMRLDEWQAAVAAIEGIRLEDDEAQTMTHPKTGEKLVMQSDDGDVEVYFPEDDEWIPVFHWYERNGTASCNARFQPGDTTHPVWNAAVALASALGAVVQGDEGEIYDLQTGEIVDS